ncbi:glycosyltransferase [Patulibacter sp. SYSU D01012]|uniref:glycosyltransferase n=1 Tax=Patulibacter sp. SYSU D01012 TaxID=2817381 RepID=UPI001B3155F7|nr:glycosyltransferase [Patulibacter sp. SYSU D01012]
MTALPPLPEVPLVSVYCTAYNHERFVAEAVESVLAQDWPADRLQFVILDDGSTDGTLAALEPYRDRATVLTQENRGLRGAVNRAMGELHGDLITSISGDDVWVPGRVRRMVEALRANPRAAFVHSDLEVIDDRGALLYPSFRTSAEIPDPGPRPRGMLLKHNAVCGAGVMQRGCLKHLVHPIPDHAPWEDYWWAWALSGAGEAAYLPEVTCRYRLHDSNISLGATPEQVHAHRHAERHLRREMLRGLRPGEVAAADAVTGLRAFRGALVSGAGALRSTDDPAVAVTADDRAHAAERAAAARAALAAGDAAGAVVHAVAGLADDPVDGLLDAWLEEVVAAHGAHLPAEPELRGRVVLADADALAADPALLGGYVATVHDGDDLTLVIHGRGWTDGRLVEAFGPALEHADADVLATGDEPHGRAALVARAHAALGPVPGGEALPAFAPVPAAALA